MNDALAALMQRASEIDEPDNTTVLLASFK